MVAPSLLMVTSCNEATSQYRKPNNKPEEQERNEKMLTPISSTSILSNPTGPSELLTMLAIDTAAKTIQYKKRDMMIHWSVIAKIETSTSDRDSKPTVG